jgi:hypothetical protein
MKRTLTFVGVAAVLVLLAFATSPRTPNAEALRDQGGAFFPEFTDATRATSLEVGEYDEKRAKLNRFNVALVDGKWSIPSHHNYPADAKDRLGKVAASMVGILKETLRSERPQDHELFGVLDPYDENAGAAGRGRRVTLKDVNGRVLADYIFGKETRDGSGTRYVRVPDQKRTYTTKAKLDFSTKFEDWIETDLLKATQPSIRRVTIDNYSIDLERGRIKDRSTYFLSREDSAAAWKVSSAKDTEEPNGENISSMLSAITDLKIVGVRPKPAFLVKDLKASGDFKIKSSQVTQEQFASLKALERMGYYTVPVGENEFQMLSNDGEIQVSCDDGIVYSLRFGDVVVGEGEALTAGTDNPSPKPKDEKKDDKKTGTEGRYLFVTTRFDQSLIPALSPEPAAPPGYTPEKKDEKKDPKKADEKKPDDKKAEEKKDDSPEVAKYKKDKEEWDKKKTDREKKVVDGTKRNQELTDRFAGWYYVISGETFKRLRKDQKDLVKAKEAPKKDEKKEDEHKHDEKKPEDSKKDAEKKPEDPKKPDDKKPLDQKPGDSPKPDDKKPNDPKPEDKKP